MKLVVWVIIMMFFSLLSAGQISPHEGSTLNYRIIGCHFPSVPMANKYVVEIAAGHFNNNVLFDKHKLTSFYADVNRVKVEVPEFGLQYTWRVTYFHDKLEIKKSELYHFSTMVVPAVDTNVSRLRVIAPYQKRNKNYVFSDALKVMYDLQGRPVWFLPSIAGHESANVQDLKTTSTGTITFLMNSIPYEINYNGDILWKAPDTIINELGSGNYHHEFTRLSNGHYMVLGSESVSWSSIANNEARLATAQTSPDSPVTQPTINFGTIIEYDRLHNVVWSWRSSKYFTLADVIESAVGDEMKGVHENAFYFDEVANVIYVSFKNINRVLKVKYPHGDVVCDFGKNSVTGERGSQLFCHQHACKYSQNGYLYLYSNNTCSPGVPPRVVLLKESGKCELEKVWEYEYKIKLIPGKEKKAKFAKGGNVMELSDGSIFVSMGVGINNMLIVSRNKKVQWEAIPEQWSATDNQWSGAPQYRGSIISDKELEKLIFEAEN